MKLAGVITLIALLAPTQELRVSSGDLLDLYAMGEHASVREALKKASNGDLGIVLDMLRRDGAKWIGQDGARQHSRRRLIAAVFALDAAHAALDTQWMTAERIIDWACALMREEPGPSQMERTFQLAVVGLLEGSGRLEDLDEHLAHARQRFPDEPRWLLADAFKSEWEYWRLHLTIGGRADGGDPTLVLPALERAASRAENQREVALRRGFVELSAGRHEQALALLAQVPPGDDRSQLYLAHLFMGWALEHQKRSEDAIAAFRAALDAVPHAQAATLHAAALLYQSGDRAAADALVESMLSEGKDVVDPWRIYGYGDLRRVPALIAELQRAIR